MYNKLKGGFMGVLVIVILAVLAIGGAIYFNRGDKKPDDGKTQTETPQAEKELLFKLNEQNKSKESGVVTLNEVGDNSKVTLTVMGAPSGVPQPAHIHKGSCATIGDVAYTLQSAVNGSSMSELNVSLDALLAQLPLAINVHKSGPEISTYVACADVATSSTATVEERNTASGSQDAVVPKVYTVTYNGTTFAPATLEIVKGDTVKFTNGANGTMWVASDPHPSHTNYPEFNEKSAVAKDGIYEFIFMKAGSWGYHNHSNPAVKGTIVVK